MSCLLPSRRLASAHFYTGAGHPGEEDIGGLVLVMCLMAMKLVLSDQTYHVDSWLGQHKS
jgi:hypothetical protein